MNIPCGESKPPRKDNQSKEGEKKKGREAGRAEWFVRLKLFYRPQRFLVKKIFQIFQKVLRPPKLQNPGYAPEVIM